MAIVLALTLGTPIARADLYDDYLNSTSKKPFVAFLGRRGVPGHAFVAVGVELEAGLRVYERLFGLYPESGGKLSAVKLIFGKTSGKLDYKWADVSWDTEYRVYVSDQDRNAVVAKFQEWSQDAPKYSLLGNEGKNCNILAGEVASVIKLKVPGGGGSTFPWNYIETLKKVNAP